MKFLLTLVLSVASFLQLALAAPATAENPCGVDTPPGVVKIYEDFAAGTKPLLCGPVASSNSTAGTVRVNPAGGVVYWHCRAPDGTWRPSWVAGSAAFLLSNNVGGEALAAMIAPDPIAALNAVATKFMNTPLADPSLRAVWCPVVDEMYAATPAATTSPLVWMVSKNGTSLTRPSFLIASGSRSFSSKTTVPVGAPCDCSTKLVEGQITYCLVAPSLVTACSKAP